MLRLFFLVFIWSYTIISYSQTTDTNKVQLCLLLDISSSMNGLLHQAQDEIWKTATYIQSFEKDKKTTQVAIATIAYGGLENEEQYYTTLINDFDTNIDNIITGLLSLEIAGGLEYCNAAIQRAVQELSWDENASFKTIIIAGNEPFSQGPISFEHIAPLLQQKNILLNTIYCGKEQSGINNGWFEPANQARGMYTHINIDLDYEDFTTPYDNTLWDFYIDYLSTYPHTTHSLPELDRSQPIPPSIRDMIIYRFNTQEQAKDIVDWFYENDWSLEGIDSTQIPSIWKNIPPSQLKIKLFEQSQKRNTYKKGFIAYQQKISSFLLTNIHPNLEGLTLQLALEEIIKTQLYACGFNINSTTK